MGDYEFRDVPITGRAVKQLIVEHFCGGKAVERQEIIRTCVDKHIDRGGIRAKSKNSPISAFKSAATALRKLRLFEKAAHQGYWRVLVPEGFNRSEVALKKLVLYVRQNGICNGCKRPFDFRNHTVDHKIPDSNNDIDNLQLLCGGCNSMKGNRTHDYLLDKLKKDHIIS